MFYTSIFTHEGVLPDDYTIVDWGYPTYEDAITYFSGGTINAPELFIDNPFAREWLKVNLLMKLKSISDGNTFEFIDAE